ncbi:peptide/nickel transport system substrate-binding protein [Stella humosa]|uniref:Peptide/nickel transport system substrate-binding protein n=1 Tax=Stella humosa TaxID=94 RepID=A0A3N1M1P3_9PROT|nr:ABC transporter substrate-binding protein [Stella humosa]ROP99631.1 peptide/nickel transport system substrate-binding protein [Stella humosa]BBK31144.1 solute-binding transporter (periplasmic) [Stella humosa]
MRNLARTTLLAVFGLALAAAPAAAQDTPKSGGTLRILVHPEPPHLVTALGQASGTVTIGGKVFESLLTFDFELNPKPGLAERWEVSADGLTYTFHLRPNAKWHDGKPFTSADVAFTTQEFLMKTHPRARGVFSRVAAVETPDARTIVYKLKEKFSPFLYAFELSGAPMMPKHLYEGTDFDKNPANEKPIGTGPFRFVAWKKGESLQLERNPDYYRQGRPYLDGISFHFIPDAAARTVAMEQGAVDQAQFDAVQFTDLERLRRNPALTVADKGQEFIAPLVLMDMNSRRPPFDDKRFRKALMHAIDRNFIKDRIFYGQGKVPTGPIASSTRNYDPKVATYPYDQEKAKALLDEMGLKPKADGTRADIKILALPYGDHWTRLAEYLRESFRRVGVRATVENTDPGNWIQRYTNWDYDIVYTFFYQYADPALGVGRTYLCSNVRKVFLANANGYCNQRVDDLFTAATAETDETKKQAYYSEIQRLITEDLPVGFLLELQFPVVMNKRLRDAITTAHGPNDAYADAWLAR